MNPAKVVHLTTAHSALDARIFYRECRSLARAGFEVTIVGPNETDQVTDQVRVKAIPTDARRTARMTRTVWRVYREALRQQADLYHFHDPELIPIGLLLRAKGKKVIYDVHEDLPKGTLSKYYLPDWSRKLISWMADKIEMTSCPHFSALVTVTPCIEERLRDRNSRTVTVRNYPCLEDITSHSGSSPWESRPMSAAYIGGIERDRGICEMVKAMSLLPAGLQASLELAGREHPYPPEVRQDPGWSRVRYHGFLGASDVAQLLSRVRMGLVVIHPLPRFQESMPLKLFEYMGAGLPVIASNFPLWQRLLDQADCALFVDPVDPQAIARAVEYLLTHPAQAPEMGRRGQAAVREQFNWDTQANKLLGLYSDLMQPSNGGLPAAGSKINHPI